jgi:hypothetical protein
MIVEYGEYPVDPPESTPKKGGTCIWLFGRGLSSECELNWKERPQWEDLPRMVRIERIKRELLFEMDSPDVNPAPIREFLAFLDQRSAPHWRHLFVTTNWDSLLQRELRVFIGGSKVPEWLDHGAGSHVHHLNGSVEEGTQHRSPFMLEDDSGTERTETTEANYAFSYLISERTFVVVGMSFECGTDRHLMKQLKKMKDWMPVGESHWIIVNCKEKDLTDVCDRIREALPEAQVEAVESTFAGWLRKGCPELRVKRVFS